MNLEIFWENFLNFIREAKISYNYAKLTDEKEFKRNLAARIYSNSGFTSIETGKPIDAHTIAKDAINKANIFWDALPSSWKKE